MKFIYAALKKLIVKQTLLQRITKQVVSSLNYQLRPKHIVSIKIRNKKVNRELIIDSRASEVDIVLLEDKFLVELHKEKTNNNYAVGDVYLGRVKKSCPG
jgi:acyl carrier protein